MRHVIVMALANACSAPVLAPAGMDFVLGGVVVDGGIEAVGTALTDGRTLVAHDWTAGQPVQITGKSGTAEGVGPAQPSCLALFYLGLGDAPDSVLRFSADGAVVVVDNKYGRRVVDSWRGQAAPDPGDEGLVASAGEVPQRCQGEIPVRTVIAAPGGLRVAAVEGPISEGSEVGYRLTVYR
jgi:hypothetical protein